MKSDDESCEPGDEFGGHTVQIDLPGAGTAKVKTTGGGSGSGPSSGTICAKGSASDPTSTPQSAVCQLMAVGSVQLPNPPGGLQSASVDSGGDWKFDAIGGVSCGPLSNPVQNQLGVWVLFSDNVYGRQSVVFDGVCATSTDCEGSGGILAAETAGGTAVETVSRQWSVLVAEEEAHALAIFQQPVILTLRPKGGERCVWDNGANGVDAPLVELSCEAPVASVWQILYQYGTVEIRYIKLAAEINALGSNRFAAHPANPRHKAVASPTSLLVVPV